MDSNSPQTSPSSQGSNLSWLLVLFASLGITGGAASFFTDMFKQNPWSLFWLVPIWLVILAIISLVRGTWVHLEDEWSKEGAKWVDALVKQR